MARGKVFEAAQSAVTEVLCTLDKGQYGCPWRLEQISHNEVRAVLDPGTYLLRPSLTTVMIPRQIEVQGAPHELGPKIQAHISNFP